MVEIRGEQQMMSVGTRVRVRLCTTAMAAIWMSAVVTLAVLLAACGGDGSPKVTPTLATTPVTRTPSSESITLAGVGATFPMPLYHQWADDYRRRNPGVQVVYTGGGSGFGQSEIRAGTVDFGGSDQPLSRADLASAGLMQFPTCVGGVAPIVNIEGVGQGDLRLTGRILADIFLGEIVTWDDPAIQSVNPDVDLPDRPITVVHRSDSSGTTWIFTNYLTRVSGAWSKRVGAGTSVSWTTGEGANGNPGVTMVVASTPGAIGYTEYSYAVASDVAWTQLQNKAGRWVRASLATFSAAAASAPWNPEDGFRAVLVDQPGTSSWPIVGATWVLVRREQPSVARGNALLEFFDSCYHDRSAAEAAAALNYVTMPASVVEKIEEAWAKSITAGGRPCWP